MNSMHITDRSRAYKSEVQDAEHDLHSARRFLHKFTSATPAQHTWKTASTTTWIRPLIIYELLDRPGQFVGGLRHTLSNGSPLDFYVDKQLYSCSHIFLRWNMFRSSRVLKRWDKAFKIVGNCRGEYVNLDRLKAAIPLPTLLQDFQTLSDPLHPQ